MASGRNTISQRIALEGGKEIQDQLKGIGEAGERAFKQISGAASTVSGAGGQLAKGIDDAQKSMKEAQAAASKFGEGLASLGGAAGRAVTSLSALAGVATVSFAGVATALKGLAMSGAEAADAVGKSAMSLGLSVKEYGTLQFAAEQSGVAADQFGATMSRLNAQIEKTKDTTDPTTTALGKLGVKVTESNGELRPTSSILGDIAERFKAMPDGASKSAAAIEIFGRQAGPRLIPLLNEGRAGIAALTAEAEKSGLVFTELEVKFGTDMNDALSQMSRTAKATRDHIGLMFAPVIKEAADAVTEFLRDNQGAIQECGRSVVNVVAPVLRDIIKMMSGQGDDKIDTKWLLTIRDVFSGMGTAIRSTYDGLIAPTFREMKAIIDTLLIPINAVFGTKINAQTVLFAVTVAKVSGAFSLLATAVNFAKDAYIALKAATTIGFLVDLGTKWAALAATIRGATLAVFLFAASSSTLTTVGAVFAAIGAGLISWPVVIGAVVVAIGLVAAALLGLDWATVSAAAQAAWEWIANGFRQANAALVADGGMTMGQLQGLWNGYVENVRTNLARIAEVGIWAWLGEQLAKIGTEFSELGAKIKAGFLSWIDEVQGRWQAWANWARGLIDSLIAKFRELFRAKEAAASAGEGGNSAGGFPVPAFSNGGRVWGAGTATSDSIPARLSAGEYVIRERAVRHYGPRLFDMLNRMALARDSLRGFAGGGLVDALRGGLSSLGSSGFGISSAGLAGAGAGHAGRTLNLTIDGETFSGLMAPEETAERLVRFALGKQIRTAGRKPNWYGGGR